MQGRRYCRLGCIIGIIDESSNAVGRVEVYSAMSGEWMRDTLT
jgi:hypothetical protein